jgi:hypothetical protein
MVVFNYGETAMGYTFLSTSPTANKSRTEWALLLRERFSMERAK